MTDFNNGLTEGTNMMVDYLANSEKLIPELRGHNSGIMG
jgi:hypothetical protein